VRRRRTTVRLDQAWRRVTVGLRALPDFVIIGAQRGGTTSLFRWLVAQPGVGTPSAKEMHYFDNRYGQGARYYRRQFPVRRRGHITGESSPYMLFHPLAPERAARDLPATTRFIVLLRDPVDRAVSHYWHERDIGFETESLARAVELEPQRLAGQDEIVRRGERSAAHQNYSYVARGEYAVQLRRWFEHVDRQRFLVVESERMFHDPATSAEIATWLGLAPDRLPFPNVNSAPRTDGGGAADGGETGDAEATGDGGATGDAGATGGDGAVRHALHRHFAAHNRELFELLGTTMWGAEGTAED
jgi:hypothetical protein